MPHQPKIYAVRVQETGVDTGVLQIVAQPGPEEADLRFKKICRQSPRGKTPHSVHQARRESGDTGLRGISGLLSPGTDWNMRVNFVK